MGLACSGRTVGENARVDAAENGINELMQRRTLVQVLLRRLLIEYFIKVEYLIASVIQLEEIRRRVGAVRRQDRCERIIQQHGLIIDFAGNRLDLWA